ncbi:hypothetical protein ACHHYP_01539 [Achlya hypogyna]|uniref:Uncharacterized protein n=1 Tax=Achlya hypogyna TaxID=1202772 RepID=A0A1V9Z8F9_ACHHY|nr:hypothetical protein ACHHYP_01539 [Achlya hypogyna]
MGAPAGLLAEVQKQLEGSPFEYNQSLVPHVLSVWCGLGAYIERQLLAHRALFLPAFGKFTFLKGKDDAPAFLFSDKFLRAHPRVVTKRPLAALTMHGADANYSTVAAEAGVMKDQAQAIVEAIFQLVGDVTETGARSTRLPLGSLGTILIDGKSLHFRFEPSFVLKIASSTTAAADAVPRMPTVTETLERMAGIAPPQQVEPPPPRPAVTINSFMQPPVVDPAPKKAATEKRRTKRPSPQLVKCASDSIVGVVPPSILPRFLVPDRPRASFTTSAVQQLIVEQAYRQLNEDKAVARAHETAVDADYDARFRNAELRTLKQRAEKALCQRDRSAHLTQQVAEKIAFEARSRLPDPPVPMTILPQAKPRTKSEEKARKAVLRQQLDDQVATKQAGVDMRAKVARDEERFFIDNVHRQDKLERHEAAVQRQLDKETLLKEWSRQMQNKK